MDYLDSPVYACVYLGGRAGVRACGRAGAVAARPFIGSRDGGYPVRIFIDFSF